MHIACQSPTSLVPGSCKWMNEWMNRWMNERMNEWMNEWMKEWMNECNKQITGWVSLLNGSVYQSINQFIQIDTNQCDKTIPNKLTVKSL